jgi:hypothetical protein
MRIYQKTTELADKFDAVYPEELPARLRWWSKNLDIDRVRLLRLMGMSARQARESKDRDLKEILKSPIWESKAQLVEGALHRLLALFHYDWHTLAERSHNPVVPTEPAQPSRVSHRKGAGTRPRSMLNGDGADLLLRRLAEGGPQALPALLEFLASAADAHPADS